MDDPALVDLLAAGDPVGLAAVYDAYSVRLFAYCTSLLHDRHAAADAVHDTILIARERADQLREPERLRPWLYAIARNECLRALRDRRRIAELAEAGEVTDDAPELEAALRADELRELVWSAAAALSPSEREVLDLSVRHGLEGADLADALGVSAKHASALLSRARAQLERALAALVLARTGRDDCPELDGMLADWDGRLTPLLRKRLVRHLEKCAICGEQRRLRVSAAALLSGVPFLFVPRALRRKVLQDADDVRLVAEWEALAARAGPFRSDGFPRPFDRRRRVLTGWWSAAAGVAVAGLLVLGLVLLPGPAPRPVVGQALGTTATEPAPNETPTPIPTPTPPATSLARTLAPPPPPLTRSAVVTTMPTTPAPTTRASTGATTTTAATTTSGPSTTPAPPPPTPTITTRWAVSGTPDCVKNVWAAQLDADVTGAQAQKVVARWYVDPTMPKDVPMTVQPGTLWSVVVTDLPTNTPITWHATVTTVDGVVTDSASAPLQYDCPPG